jgi:hypothetical protein
VKDGCLGGDIGQHRWRVEEPTIAQPRAAGEHGGAAITGIFYQPGDRLNPALVSQWPDLRIGRGAIPELPAAREFREAPGKAVCNARFHEEARRGEADLPRVLELRPHQELGRRLGVRIPQTIAGAWPPSSIVTGFINAPAAAASRLPIRIDPVKVIFATPGAAISRLETWFASPKTTATAAG